MNAAACIQLIDSCSW